MESPERKLLEVMRGNQVKLDKRLSHLAEIHRTMLKQQEQLVKLREDLESKNYVV